MSNLGNLSFKVLGDLSQFNKDIANVNRTLNNQTKGLQTLARGFTTVGDSLVKGVTLPIIAMGVALFKIGKDFDDAYDRIRVGTGKTGKELEGLQKDFKEIAKVAPSSFKDISIVVADLNTRLGLTGKPLQDISKQMLNLARITETDVNSVVRTSTRLFGDWGVATEDYGETLDYLYKISQSTGVGIDTLSDKMTTYGVQMRTVGFTLEESLALMGKWEKEGVSAEKMLGGLSMALGRFAKAGLEPEEAMRNLMEQIEKAPTVGEAMALAVESLGTRAGPDFALAVREGRFAIEDFMEALGKNTDTINGAAKATDDWKEKLILLKNNISISLEPLATKVFDAIGKGVEKVTPKVEELAKWFGNLTPAMQDNFIKWGLIATIIPVVISGLGRATTAAIKFRNSLLLMNAAITPKLAGFASAIGLTAGQLGAIAAIAPLVAKGLNEVTLSIIDNEKEGKNWFQILTDILGVLSLNPQYLNKSMMALFGWNKATKESTEAIEEQIPAIDKAKESVDEYRQSLIDEGRTKEVVTEMTNVYAESLGYVADEQGDLTEAQEENIEVTEEQTEAVDDLIASLYKLYNLNQSVTEATWDYEDSLAELDKVMKDANSTERDKQKAIFDTQDKLENLQIAMAKELSDTDTSIERKKELQNQYIKTGLEAVNAGAMSEEAFFEMAKTFGLTTADIIENAQEMGIEIDTAMKERIVKLGLEDNITGHLKGIEARLAGLVGRTYQVKIETIGGSPVGGALGGIFTGKEFLRPMVSALEGIMIPKFDTGGVLALLHPPEIVLNAKEAMQLVWNMANRPVDTKGAKGGIVMYNTFNSPKPLTESEINRNMDMTARELGYRMGL